MNLESLQLYSSKPPVHLPSIFSTGEMAEIIGKQALQCRLYYCFFIVILHVLLSSSEMILNLSFQRSGSFKEDEVSFWPILAAESAFVC